MFNIALIGCGEAAEALSEPLREQIQGVWDIKLLDDSHGMRERIGRLNMRPADSVEDAVSGADLVISLVTADQAQPACEAAAPHLKEGALYLECNSCSPGTKKHNAAIIEQHGGKLVDVAIMSPVNPARINTPLLLSGQQAAKLCDWLSSHGYNAKYFANEIGQASAVKMTRSIMIKGMEALTAECLLTAKKLGIDDTIIASLDGSFPGFDWMKRGGYNLERMAQHGIRRAAEMREVAITVAEAELPNEMTQATVAWQQRLGELALQIDGEDFNQLSEEILSRRV